MLSQSLRERLARLNRAPLPEPCDAQTAESPIAAADASNSPDAPQADGAPAAICQPGMTPSSSIALHVQALRERLAQQAARVRAQLTTVPGPAPTVEQPVSLPAGELLETSAGRCYRILTPLAALAGREPSARRTAVSAVSERGPRGALSARQHAELHAAVAAYPDGLVLLDLETSGLAGAAIFLVGLVRWLDGGWMVEQLLARNFAEEPAILAALGSRMAGARVLVTFNGKSFDWPLVLDRVARHRLTWAHAAEGRPWPSRHCDVLHHARRSWRGQLPDCKLQTLERVLCGRRRHNDIEGAEIPAAYRDFVRTGQAGQLRQILHHNAHDLATLLDLLHLLAGL